MTTLSQQVELSPDAARLLAYLQAYADQRGLARTDRYLAALLRVPIRQVIDLADELIRAGHVVQAEVQPPHGRWLNRCQTADMVREAQRYAASLHDRGVSILTRRKHLVEAIAAAEARRQTETTGQHRLF